MSTNRAIRLVAFILALFATFAVSGQAASASTQVTAQNWQHGDGSGRTPGGGGTDW